MNNSADYLKKTVRKCSIKYFFAGSVLLLLSLNLQAQTPAQQPDWISMMKDPTANVHDVQNAFYNWYNQQPKTKKEKDKDEKGNPENDEDESYSLFKRWEWFNVPRADAQGNRADWKQVGKDYQNFLNGNNSRNTHTPHSSHSITSTGGWTYVGNTTVPANSNIGGIGGNGRVNRVRTLPGNNNTIFACTATGGLWESTNGGTSWFTNTDQLGDLSTSDIAINPLKTNIMYLATGDGDGLIQIYPVPQTIGVLKSYDGGVTWNATSLSFTLASSASGAGYNAVTEIIIDPADTSVILAATSRGIYRSTNSGTSWTKTVSEGWFHSIEFMPGKPDIVYAASESEFVSGGFYRSTDNGVNWTHITIGLPTAGNTQRLQLAVSNADPRVVYVLADRGFGSGTDFQGLYRSTDTGKTFSTRSTAPNLLGRACDGSDATVGQGWYDLAIGVSQYNSDSVWVGGINIWRSGNGGASWTLNAEWTGSCASYVHADIHSIQFIPGVGKSYLVGCDGGVFKTINNGTTWTNLSNNLANSEQYSIGASATTAGLVITGWQDNGTNLSKSPYSQVYYGDGMVCFIDWNNNNIFYAETPQGSFARSADAGSTWSIITNNINESGPWVTQWLQDPKTSTTLYGGFKNVWKSTNSGSNWSKISTWGSSSITAIAVDSANPNYIYAAQSNLLEYTTNGGTTWTSITSGLPTGSANILSIAVSAKQPSHVWVAFSGYSSGNKVFASTNFGATWTNISSGLTGLPNLPVNCVVSESGSPNGIYAGTDQGVYYHDTILNGWVFYNTGLPLVMIGDMKIFQPGKTLVAATYGRGTWQSPIFIPVTVAANVTSNVLCNGNANGVASASPTNGTSPFTYSWSNGATTSSVSGLTAGTYTVYVQDTYGGYKPSSTVIITQPTALAGNAAVNNNTTSCSNSGKASSSPAGGTSPYTYSWTGGSTNSSISNLSAGTYTVTVKDANNCNTTASVAITAPAAIAPNATAAQNATACVNNGIAASTPTGGNSPYTYSWTGGGTNSSISNLSAGTYTVTVTDATNCNTSASVTITQSATPITYTIFETPVSCHANNDGGAQVYPSGGATPYTYSWSSGTTTNIVSNSKTPTGLSEGTYSVTIMDANGCSTSTSINITGPSPFLALGKILENVVCKGSATGGMQIIASGGKGPYTYSWSNGNRAYSVGYLSAGTYTCTATDKCGSTATVSVTITEPATQLTQIVTFRNVTCNGNLDGIGSTTISGGDSPYTYLWLNGATTSSVTGLSAGAYNIKVTDANGCMIVKSFNLAQPALIVPTVKSQSCVALNNGTAGITVTGGTIPYTYSWNTGQTKATQTGLSNGTYTITVTDKNHCTGTVQVIVSCTSSPDREDLVNPDNKDCCPISSVTVYPNPNNGQFIVSGLEQGMKIEIFDYTGKRVFTQYPILTTPVRTGTGGQYSINLSDKPNGVYLIRIINADGTLVDQKKVVKTN